MVNPYIDDTLGHVIVRTFDTDVNEWDLVWHRDLEDRIVEVIEGEGWQFQFDNLMPFPLTVGDSVSIPKMVYHRILKGSNRLVLHIIESRDIINRVSNN